MRRRALAAGIASLLGCGGAGEDDSSIDERGECGIAEVATPSGCEPAGLPRTSCAPGEVPQESGCAPAGVPPERCPAGFTPENGGCYPVLPATPCRFSTVALPGETTCRPLVSCGAGRYGDIPVEADTEYVDGSFIGASDGSADQPWTTVQEAMAAAAPGALIAVAAGSYTGPFSIQGKALRVWGTCPQEVELVGPDSGVAAIEFVTGASGSELHHVAVTGARGGIGMSGAENVLLDGVWVHDTAQIGLIAEGALGSTSLTLTHSLIERVRAIGIVATGVEITVDATAVRDVAAHFDGSAGVGIVVQAPSFAVLPSNAHITDSLIERTRESGIMVAASHADIERVVVRDTAANELGTMGHGVAFFYGVNGASADGSLVESTIERSQEAAINIATSSARLDAVTVHHTLPSPMEGAGVGVLATSAPPARSFVELTQSLIDASTEVGVVVGAADGVIEGALVRGTLPSAAGLYGWGIVVQEHPETGQRASAQVRYSVVEAVRDVGIFVGSSDAVVETTAVRDVTPGPSGRWGIGVSIQSNPAMGTPSVASITASVIERVASTGILVVSAQAQVDRCLVRDVFGDGLGLHGDAVSVASESADASLAVRGSRLEKAVRAGLSSFGATASLADNAFVCHAFDLEGETHFSRPHRFENLGNNGCGCSDPVGECKAVSAGLAPPEPLDPYAD